MKKWAQFGVAASDLHDAATTAHESFAASFEPASEAISVSQKFYLPGDAAQFIGSRAYADIWDLLNLPFDCISILSDVPKVDTDEMIETITVAFDVHGTTNRSLRYVNPDSLPHDAWIVLMSVSRVNALGAQRWMLNSAPIAVSKRNGDRALVMTPLDTAFARCLIARSGLDASFFAREMEIDLYRIVNLCAMLGVKNVRPLSVPVPAALCRKRAKRGRKPLYSYHVLEVDGELWDRPEPADSGDITIRSHLRRGHIRRLADGRCVWVRAAYVHGRADGFVAKDYRASAPRANDTTTSEAIYQ